MIDDILNPWRSDLEKAVEALPQEVRDAVMGEGHVNA